MLKTLIKKQLLELFQTYYVNKKTGKARGKGGTVGFFVMLVALFAGLGFAFYSMSGGLGVYILGYDINWLYFALMGLLSIALGVFGSVFNTYASLYLPKDNEFLISLPIPGKTLLLSRVAGVYVTSLMYSAWVWIPACIAYWVLVPPTTLTIIFPILLTFVIALFVSVLSCLLGWVVAIIASKAKGKSFLTVFLSLFVMVAYYVVYFKVINSLNEIVEHLDELGSTVQSWLHYIFLLGKAADGDVVSMLIVLAITAVLAFLCLKLLERNFMKVALASSGNTTKVKKMENFAQIAPQRALLRREFKHFTETSTWMLNCGLGILIMPLLAIAAMVKSASLQDVFGSLEAEMPAIYDAFPVIIFAGFCLVISLNAIEAVAVSAEGKSMWIVQTLPVDTWDIIRAKETMGNQLNLIPGIISVVVLCLAFRMEALFIVLITIATAGFIFMMTDLALVLDIKRANLNWTNIAALTKQSMPVMICLFGGWGICLAMGLGGIYLCTMVDAWLVLAGYIVIFAVVWALLHNWLKKRGAKLLAHL